MTGQKTGSSQNRLQRRNNREILRIFDQPLHLVRKIIADIYKERWQIKLFFKEIKQNLRIKSVVEVIS